jgi:hypothetical protein
MINFVCDEMDPNFLFPYETISKITKNTIKITKEVKKVIQISTTLFIHYLADYSVQLHQRENGELK